jgi:ankyrin repeat protein
MVSKDMTKLMDAALSIDSQADDLLALLESGERVNAKTSYGFTALHCAACEDECGELEDRCRRVKILVDAGADIEAVDDKGRTPLLHAAEEGGPGQVKALLEAGANPNAQDQWGYTPLIIALDAWRATEKIPLLLSFGAKPEIQDAEQMSAIDHSRFKYELWKGITEEHVRADLDVRDLLNQIPAHIRGRLKPATIEVIRSDLSEALSRRHVEPYNRNPAEFLKEAECVLNALGASK